ncbi:MAG: GNAT family N-acetyltransferase [Defluviitaleaceae bacterium]|nr:GNAT family N-acetyltransferase [Defluviitaleaceae bacterium]
MEHKGTKKIETKRLSLRPFTTDDANSMYNNWANNPEVTKYLSWEFHENIDETKQLLMNWISEYKNMAYYQWAIVMKEESNEPVGSISVVGKNDLVKSLAIGYCIGKQWWNKGITSEALAAIVKFFFEEVKVNRIAANFLPENSNSGKVLSKCGFKYEGTLRESTWSHSHGISDSVIYSILKKDYDDLNHD